MNIRRTVPHQIGAIRSAFADTFSSFGLSEPAGSEIRHFARMAPSLPKGDDLAVLLPRIRFGQGDEGVATTWLAHLAQVPKTFRIPSSEELTVSRASKRLRLLGGNQTHKPGMTWGILYPNANRDHRIGAVRRSVTEAPRSPSAADEILVFAWMFPEYIRNIDNEKILDLRAGGYEYDSPARRRSGPWDHTLCIGRLANSEYIDLNFVELGFRGPRYTVPIFSPRPA